MREGDVSLRVDCIYAQYVAALLHLVIIYGELGGES